MSTVGSIRMPTWRPAEDLGGQDLPAERERRSRGDDPVDLDRVASRTSGRDGNGGGPAATADGW